MSETAPHSAARPFALPPQFELIVRDDSMAPLVRSGDIARFVAGHPSSEEGPPVLVVDARGDCYIRQIRRIGCGHWQAVPLNPTFDQLDSHRDELKIVAVMKGLDWI